MDYQFSAHWAACAAGYVGGSWFDFNGFAVSGKVVDSNWGIRAGVDRLVRVGSKAVMFVGVGADYGEARSWLDNLTISQAGPHNYFAGGSARLGVAAAVMPRLQAYGELLPSFYRGHAKDGTSGYEYNWLGRSLTYAIGIRFVAKAGRDPLSDAVAK